MSSTTETGKVLETRAIQFSARNYWQATMATPINKLFPRVGTLRGDGHVSVTRLLRDPVVQESVIKDGPIIPGTRVVIYETYE